MNPNERRADGQHAPRLECGCFARRARPRVLMPDDPRHADHDAWHRTRRLAGDQA